MPKTSA